MPRERSDMRRVKELLRLAHELGYSKRQIAVSIRMPKTTVNDYLARAEAAGLRYGDVAGMSEEAVEALLFQRARTAANAGLGVGFGRAWQARRDAGLGRIPPAAPKRLQLQPVPAPLPGPHQRQCRTPDAAGACSGCGVRGRLRRHDADHQYDRGAAPGQRVRRLSAVLRLPLCRGD